MDMKRPAQYLSLLLSLSLIFPSCTPTPPMEEEDEFPKQARIRGAFEQEWTATHDPATGTVPRQRLQ